MPLSFNWVHDGSRVRSGNTTGYCFSSLHLGSSAWAAGGRLNAIECSGMSDVWSVVFFTVGNDVYYGVAWFPEFGPLSSIAPSSVG